MGVMVIMLVLGLLLLAALLGGLFFLLHRHDETKTPLNIHRGRIADPTSKKSIISTNDTAIKEEFIDPQTNTSEGDIVSDSGTVPENTNINVQKSRRGGYSKQQFDEFE